MGNKLRASLNGRIVDQFDDVQEGGFEILDYARIDLNTFYNFTPDFSVSLRIANLLDEQCRHQHLAGSRIGGDAGNVAASGRIVSIAARYSFDI